MSKKKLLTSITALALAATMALGGTFAWQSINQTVVNEGSSIVNPGGRLHDDFDGENKDVYVENFASQPIFTRIRLEEYFKVAVNTGHGNRFSQDVIGEAVTDGEGNVTDLDYRIFTDYDRLNEENNTISACWELDSEEEPMTSYFQWTMGSADSADAWYMPTFNLNKDSLAADVNGYYDQGLGIISSKDDVEQYSDYTAYNADSTENGTEIYDADENAIDEVGKDFSEDNLAQYVTAGNIMVKENQTHTAKAIADTSGLISMEKWLEKYDAAVEAAGDEEVDMSELNSYWVYDTDGWVYWSGAIAASETTGRLLDSIEMTERMEDGWYYALNVVAQFITANDLGQKEGNTGFYDESSGTPPTENALKLLDAIGVNTTDAESAEALDQSNWVFTVTDNDGDDTNNPDANPEQGVSYSGIANEFQFAFGGRSGWTWSFIVDGTGYDNAPYSATEDDSTVTIKKKDSDTLVATWDKTTHKLTVERGQTLTQCHVQVEKTNNTGGTDTVDITIKSIECREIDWSEQVTMRNITSAEYDKLVEVTGGEDEKMHWQLTSWTSTYKDGDGWIYVQRGGTSADATDSRPKGAVSVNVGLRPAFAAKSANVCAGLKVGDVVVMGTLYVGASHSEESVKVPANPIRDGDTVRYDSFGSIDDSYTPISLKTALEDTDYQMKAVYVGDGLFVCDRVMLGYISGAACCGAITTA